MKKIDQFINTELTPEQEKTFLTSLFSNYYDGKLKTKWKKALKEEYKISPTKKSNSRRKYLFIYLSSGIAACLLAVLVVMNIGSNDPVSFARSQLLVDSMQHPDVVKGSSTGDEQLLQAAIAFNNKQFQEVINLYNLYELSSQLSAKEVYYKALAMLHVEDYGGSSSLLNQLIDDTTYGQEARWYYSLSMILQGDHDGAEVVLQSIGSEDWKFNEAQKFLELLR